MFGGNCTSSGTDDVTIEVLDGDTVIASGNDVADPTCEADFNTANCGVIVVRSGVGYTIGEPTVENSVLTSVACDEFLNWQQAPVGGAVVEPIGDDGFRTDDGDTYCAVTNTAR